MKVASLLAWLSMGLALLLLVSCTSRGPVTVQHGETTVTIGQRTNFAAKSYDRYAVTKAGTLTITTRDDGTEVAGELIRTAGVAYGAWAVANVQNIANESDAAVAIVAQKAGVASQKIAADEAVALRAQGVTRATVLPK